MFDADDLERELKLKYDHVYEIVETTFQTTQRHFIVVSKENGVKYNLTVTPNFDAGANSPYVIYSREVD